MLIGGAYAGAGRAAGRASIGTGFGRASPCSRADPSPKRVRAGFLARAGLLNTQAMDAAARAAAATNQDQTNPSGVSHGTPNRAPPWTTEATLLAAEGQSPVVPERAPTSTLAKPAGVGTGVEGTAHVSLRALPAERCLRG